MLNGLRRNHATDVSFDSRHYFRPVSFFRDFGGVCMSFGGVKRTPADDAFSKCVRAANGYRCEKCGAQHDKSSTGLHCSHIFGRRHRTIRWAKDNAQSLCARCHTWYGENPADSGKWLVEQFGEGYLQILRDKRDSGIKVPKVEEKLIARHYRQELKKIEQKRDEGETGYIDFESWQ